MKLTDEQKDLIFGTLLGDGNLQSTTQGRTWRYRAIQKGEHKPYLDKKFSVLKSLCTPGSLPTYGEIVDKRTNKTSERWYFNTLTQDCLRLYGNMFYTYDKAKDKFIKDVPKNLSQHLTPRAIAYMYMDDGGLKWKGHSNAMRICTESFSVDGVILIQKVFKNKFNIDTTLTSKTLTDGTVGKRISIPEKSSGRFRELIQDFLIDCMKYKVSDGLRNK